MIIVCVLGGTKPVHAQNGLTVGANAIFYGDNTEFRNPFREGETIFGAAVRAEAGIELSDSATLSLGIFGNQRFGSDDAFELVRPVLALSVKHGASTFVFGTLTTPRAGEPAGPDRTGPHGLLPPIQREVLAFERPYEAGLQWMYAGPSLEHDMWLQWQRLNTREHRERLDAGARVEWFPSGHLAIPVQAHIVHEGGQLFAAGPVRDSFVLGSGLALASRSRNDVRSVRADGSRSPARLNVMVELVGLWSRYTADREAAHPTRAGGAFFGRASAELRGWRAHLIAFRGDDFIKDEGDPNYQSLRRDGTRYRGVRDYAEAGLTRTFVIAAGARIETSFRFHRVERHYEYSYRVLGVVRARARVK